MKNIIIIFSFLFLFSCQNSKESLTETKKVITIQNNTSLVADKSNKKSDSIEISQVEIKNSKLIGMIKIDSRSKKVTEKYGFDVSNGCYSCNLASFKIDDENVLIENYCDSTQIIKMKILNLKSTPYKIEIITNAATLIFTKKEMIPIFELAVKGDIRTNLIINKYFTTEKKLSAFALHDCGDFEG